MSAKLVRVFEGTHVPSTFETLLVPWGDDPDGLGPLTDEDRILRIEFEDACHNKVKPLKRLSEKLYEHQKYQLKNSHVIVGARGEPADNMDIEDICAWLAKLDALIPHNPDHVFGEVAPASRYSVPSWVIERCEDEGVFIELIDAAGDWNDEGALELSAYPGTIAIEGDGNYPIFEAHPPDFDLDLAMADCLPPEFGGMLEHQPSRTQSRLFIDYQFKPGHSGNKKGRPRRPRETEEIDECRPHFFDTPMPPDSEGTQITYGERIFEMARNRAAQLEDKSWLLKMTAWARELKGLRNDRMTVQGAGFVYEDTLAVTRIDVAIRHLDLVTIEWRKSPSARWVLNPWLVSAALERMKKTTLTRAEMEGIYVRTRTPHHVDWPKWWPEDLRCKHKANPQLTRPRRKISGTIRKA